MFPGRSFFYHHCHIHKVDKYLNGIKALIWWPTFWFDNRLLSKVSLVFLAECWQKINEDMTKQLRSVTRQLRLLLLRSITCKLLDQSTCFMYFHAGKVVVDDAQKFLLLKYFGPQKNAETNWKTTIFLRANDTLSLFTGMFWRGSFNNAM